MSIKSFFICAAAFLFIISCNNNTTQVLLQDETDTHLQARETSVSLLIIEPEPLYNYFPDHVYGALRPTEKMIFDNDLLQLFRQQTQSPVVGKKVSEDLVPDQLESRRFELEAGPINLISPKQGTDLSTSNINSRFTVILDKYHFSSYQVETGGGSYAGHEGDPQNRIRLDTAYIIWDNEQKREIGWGMVNASHILYGDDATTSYQNVIKSAFQKIIKVSPFIKSDSV
ncbi:hypothetical protein [Rhodohalobacter barkolensis]|uniref:DUF4136 domain-containing protein n=1 Tax=Rhodohalobacter barkolensis TaxID=2053187 RepID=A0A2N0VFC9_9BACT|nr:hypothetical protein [Rhodohalobacter barkolensis]PKD42860.1 hypothetical protein CWD77_13495 [Rhodohalobacter barkolensis]